jgi:hypothetical protein
VGSRMSDYRMMLEHDLRRVGPATFGLEQLARRSKRKRRNQRVSTAIVALMLTAAAVGALIKAFDEAGQRRPAGEPQITPSTVARLRVAWASAPVNTFSDGRNDLLPRCRGRHRGRRDAEGHARLPGFLWLWRRHVQSHVGRARVPDRRRGRCRLRQVWRWLRGMVRRLRHGRSRV